jgi:CHAD domain-containing protein
MSRQFELNLLEEPEEMPVPKRRSNGRAHGRGGALTLIEFPSSKPKAGPAEPVKAVPSILKDGASAEEAFRLILLQCKWHLAANMPAVAESRHVEGMHQLRVAFRRLRVALTSFGHEFRTPSLMALRNQARQLCERLAFARDLDVFMDELFEPAATANGSLEAFAVLRARAQAARKTAWDNAVAQISGPAFKNFIADLGEAIDKRIWFEGAHGHARPKRGLVAFEAPAVQLAGRTLEHRLARAAKRARHLGRLDDAERHALRISLKKLRYTSEFFAPLFEAKDVSKFLRRISAMQDILGALNDVVVARETLERLVDVASPGETPRAELSFAAGIVYGWHLDRAARTWEKGRKTWKKFTRTERFWDATEAN